jgi:hypothetical protein
MSADKIHLPAEESQIIVDKLIENQEIKAIVIPNKKLS